MDRRSKYTERKGNYVQKIIHIYLLCDSVVEACNEISLLIYLHRILCSTMNSINVPLLT